MNEPDLADTIREMLAEFASEEEAMRDALIVQNPRFLTRGFIAMASEVLGATPVDHPARSGLAWLDTRFELVDKDISKYPLGRGPVEAIARKLTRGEIDRAEARRLAREPEHAMLTTLYARALAMTIQVFSAERWELARDLGIVTLAMGDALPEGAEAETLARDVVSSVTALLQRVLVHRPDPDLLSDVLGRIDLLASKTTGTERGLWLRLYGSVLLDTYTAERSPTHYRAQMDAWQTIGDDIGLPLAARGMPTPADALAAAASKLRDAATLLEGRAKGLALKAFVQAELYRSVGLGVLIDQVAVEQAVSEAARLLDPERDIAHLSMLGTAAQLLGFDGPALGSEAPATASAGSAFAELDAHRRTVLSLADRDGTEALPDVSAVVARAERELEAPAPKPAIILALAIRAATLDASALAVQLIERARALAPQWEVHDVAFGAMRGLLLEGAGVEAFEAGDLIAATEHYLSATIRYELANLTDLAVRTLGLAVDCACKSPLAAIMAIRSFGTILPRLESRLGAPGARHCQAFVAAAMTAVLQNSPAAESVPILGFAKGAQLAAALALGILEEELAAAPAAELDDVRAELADLGDPDLLARLGEEWASFDESLFLLAPTEAAKARGGRTDIERLVNKQRQIDSRSRARSLPAQPIPFALDDQLRREALGPGTALLEHLMHVDGDAQRMVFWLSTASGTTVTATPWEPYTRIRTDDTVWAGDATLRVRELRKHITLEPGPRPVNREALKWLDNVYKALVAPIDDQLAKLQAEGIEHLSIVPHGPYHFCPIHLVGPDGTASLADRFLVTYLPNATLLAPRERPDREGLLAVGLTFAGTARSLDGSATACARIAALVSPSMQLVDDDASRAAFQREVQRHRFVHLSTHGRQHVEAPGFHELSLADGPFFALDALKLDLTGVDVLSLAACETALGRFDPSDNLSGLPAAFFRAGVRTMIGTFWPVRPDPAANFFNTFYESLGRGERKLSAFRVAQQATRKAFPKYRDWGAFALLGEW